MLPLPPPPLLLVLVLVLVLLVLLPTTEERLLEEIAELGRNSGGQQRGRRDEEEGAHRAMSIAISFGSDSGGADARELFGRRKSGALYRGACVWSVGSLRLLGCGRR